MAVYRKHYRRYEGALEPAWRRFLVLPRYAFQDMRQRRFLSLFFLSSLIWPLLCAVFIHLRHNWSALESIGLSAARLLPIDSRFFLTFLGIQGMLAFFLAAFTGPGLISPDLTNGAMQLYLARPFSRAEYVLGKLVTLLSLLSLMTWIPGLLLFALQSCLEGSAWMQEHWRVASGLFFGSLIWILLLSLLALALSAWVRWKPAAGGLMFGVFFVAAGFGAAINEILRTRWGNLLNVSHLIGSVWISLFDEPLRRGAGAVFFRVHPGEEIALWIIWADLLAICAVCLLLLHWRIRGREVVR